MENKNSRKRAAISTLDDDNKDPLPNQTDSASTSLIPDIKRPKGSSGAGSKGLKTSRIVWTIELHNRFIEAYNQLGHQGATPCRILELMKDPRLTRFHIASHLQKYHAHLLKMQDELKPRRSKFSYKIKNPNPSSVNPSMPLELFDHETNDDDPYNTHHQPGVNPAASFTKFLSTMEDDELFTLAQNQEIPTLSLASSPDEDNADLPNNDQFNEIYSMFQKCVSDETCGASYVGYKISNEGKLAWGNSNSESSPQPINEVVNMDMKLQPSPLQEQSNDLVDSPVTLDAVMQGFDIYDLLDFDSSIL